MGEQGGEERGGGVDMKVTGREEGEDMKVSRQGRVAEGG